MGKPEGKRPLGRQRRRWTILKWIIKETGWRETGLDLSVSGQGQVAGCCDHSNEHSSSTKKKVDFDYWLTVHRSIILVDLQLNAQNAYLFTYNTFIKILYMFRALPCSSSGGLRRNSIYAASGIVTLCR